MEEITNWLRSFPGWQDELFVDYIPAHTGVCGLYPMGIRVLSRKNDILGSEKLRLQSSYQLRRVTSGSQQNLPQAIWLQQLQNWVLEQSRAGLAPRLGGDTQWSVKDGKLEKDRQPGVGIYSLTLVAEYTK